MRTFGELLARLKKAGAYVNDPAGGVILTKEQLGQSISVNFEEAEEAYESGALAAAFSFDPEIVAFLKKHEGKEATEVVFKLQYLLNNSLPFSYRNYLFRNAYELGAAIRDNRFDFYDAADILKGGLASYYVEKCAEIDIDEATIARLKEAEKISGAYPKVAVYYLAYLLGDDKTYRYDKKTFTAIDDFYLYLIGCHKFDEFAKTYDEDPRFIAWLLVLTSKEKMTAWRALTERFQAKDNELSALKQALTDEKKEEETKEETKPEEEQEPESKVITTPVENKKEEITMKKEETTNDLITKRKNEWLKSDLISREDKKIIRAMSDDELKIAFGTDIEFGTAGLRGVMGPGIGNMNIYTIRKAALAYGKYVLKYVDNAAERGIVIGHDNRRNSEEFTMEAARSLASLGFKVYLYRHIVSTPEISFTVSRLNCAGGIVITASHNPKIYNGFKVYDPNGCQLVPSLIAQLQPFYDEIKDPLSLTYETRGLTNKIEYLKREDDIAYYESALKVRLDTDLDPRMMTFVYTSLHGTGYRGVEYVSRRIGYNIVKVVDQCVEDPDFTTAKSPNPENWDAYELALKVAEKTPRDLIIATDPDADRIGVVAYHDGKPVYITGNQVAALLVDYNIEARKRLGLFSEGMVLYDTIVSSKFASDIARKHGCEVVSTLTGFKFVGEQIGKLVDKEKFLFAYEESIGYILSPATRDKDALQAFVGIMEMANYYKNEGKDLVDALQDLYVKYGYRLEKTENIYFEGSGARAEMDALMARIRLNPPTKFGDCEVATSEDYQTGTAKSGDKEVKLTLPASNVLRFLLDDGSFVAIRPSGTEPKCKFYYCVVAEDEQDAVTKTKEFQEEVQKLIA